MVKQLRGYGRTAANPNLNLDSKVNVTLVHLTSATCYFSLDTSVSDAAKLFLSVLSSTAHAANFKTTTTAAVAAAA